MKKLTSFFGAAFIYFCVASMIALIAAGAAMWFKGALDRDRLYRVLAAAHGIDVITLQKKIAEEESAADNEQPSYKDRFTHLKLQSLDMDLRENAVTNAWNDMNDLRASLEVQTTRFDQRKAAYAAKLQEIADEEQATSLQELQRTLEAIRPEQAKEQILKMLEDDAMDDVVTIMRNMAIDKRKKIIAEFKDGADVDKLYDILKNIRLGEPNATLNREAQDALKNFGGAGS
jgi:hypothetical protein